MKFDDLISGKKIYVYDGSKGTMLQKLGLKGGECPELWNETNKEKVKEVYRSYKESGSDIIQTNTFQGNRPKLEEYGLGEKVYQLNFEGVKLAKEVMGNQGLVAASIGPLGKLFEPSGELTFQTAYEVFKEQVIACADGGADIINFETFTDLAEMRAALLAAKENTNLPVICSMAFEQNGKTLMGNDPFLCALVLKNMGADMVGANCSLGSRQLSEIIKRMAKAGLPLSAKPNAGLPQLEGDVVVFTEKPEDFAVAAPEYVKNGAFLIGGCCGTGPEYIKKIKQSTEKLKPGKGMCNNKYLTSSTKILNLSGIKDWNIGYIDTTKEAALKKELEQGNIDSIIDYAMDISSEDYDTVVLNIEVSDSNIYERSVSTAQTYLKLPFVFRGTNAEALEKALKNYKGIAGVILEEKNIQLQEICKKYGAEIISI